MEIILASASPQRKELLRKIIREFKVIPADIDESMGYHIGYPTTPAKIAEFLALKKAEQIARKYPQALVIGADTIVEMAGKLYGKPENDEDAARILKELRGTIQNVITGLALLCEKKNIRIVDSEITCVKMRADISDEKIEDYVKSGEGKDKAGSYAVQAKGDEFIEWLKGDYYNVVGFPVKKLYTLLRKAKNRWNLEIDLIYNENNGG